MSRRLVLACVLVALAAGACSAKEGRAVQRHAPHAQRSSPGSGERAASVTRHVVDRGVTVSWSTATDGAPVAVAADRRGVVVIIDRERVGALDLYGTALWATDLDGVVGAVPVLMGDRVIVPFSRTNGSGGCAGLDRETGEIRWRYEAIDSGGAAVAAAGALALCLMRNGQTAGVTPTWGSAQWEFTFQGDVDASTIEVPAPTAIAVDEANGVFAFVARIGAEWQLTIRSIESGHTRGFVDLGSDGAPSAPVFVGTGYFGVASGAGAFCLVAVEVEKVGRFAVPAAGGFDPAGVPLRVGGDIIVVGWAGEVTALDIASGRPRWTAHSVVGLRGVHPIVLGKAVMLQTSSGELVAFRLTDGQPIPLPADPGRAIAMLAYGGPLVAFAVGRDGDVGWIEHWEPQPGR